MNFTPFPAARDDLEEPQAAPSAVPVEPIPVVVVSEGPLVEADEHSVLGLAELLLKLPGRVERLCRDETRQAELIPRFLAIALTSFAIFSAALVLLLNAVNPEALPSFLAGAWSDGGLGPALSLALAYTLGLVAATGVCLPSFYFYGLLSGVKVSVLQITTQTVKSKAATAVLLIGVLPIYVAVVLGMIVFGVPAAEMQYALYLGLVLPFLAGLAGVRSLYKGFMGLADTLPPQRRCRRECFLRRLTLAMAACYTAVSPVMIYTLWNTFVAQF
jgi:hypothetical protein